jgi:hypothetical protein
MVKFRFQDLKIWQLAIEIADELFDGTDFGLNAMRSALCAMRSCG